MNKSRVKTKALACVLAGCAGGAAAQENCSQNINKIEKIADIQAALNCVDSRAKAAEERNKQQAENHKREMLQQAANFDIVTTNVRQVSLKEATNGAWKPIPESEAANVCYLSSVRLAPQGLCQVTYHGALERWSYNISNPSSSGFICMATCVWMELRPKPQGKE
ncbi:MAG TPA: hypothetical protein VNT33_11150 [Telluria sp.]|nr:hypothetical protein [Telluria sp.]